MINRENYEEFFLSYVDNELPAETRIAVERFVALYPDLREDLEALLQCRLEPEVEITLTDKTSLLQYEESFLLYVDGELDEAGRKRVEDLARQHPSKGFELKRLLMTVSLPDPAVVCPDKEGLYRSDRRRRVVLLPWLQVGAAAAVIAAVVLFALPRNRRGSDTTSGTAITGVTTHGVASAHDAAHRDAAQSDAAGTKNLAAPVTPDTALPLYPVKKQTEMNVATSKPAKNRTVPAGAAAKPKDPAGVDKGSGDLAVKMQVPMNSTTPGSAAVSPDPTTSTKRIAATDPSGQANPDKAATNTIAAVYIPKEQSSFATQALLKEQEGQDDGTDHMPPATGKTKLRGLFRRVTRAFGKTADRDDDGQRQVLISAFQVGLK